MQGILFAAIIMLAFYAGTNYYIAKRAYQWLNLFLPHINGIVFTVLYICIAFSIVFGFLPVPSGIKRIISWISSHWMGVYVYLLMLILLTDLLFVIANTIKVIPFPAPRHISMCAGLMVIAMTAGLTGYGIHNARTINRVSYTIQTNKDAYPAGITIALISDLHLGAVNSENNLSRIVQGINDARPDIVCIAGDIFNDDLNALRQPSQVIDLLRSIEAPYGVYACLGNHDGGKTFREMLRFLERSNIRLLNDEYVIVDDRLVICGRVDPSPIGGFGGLERKETADIILPAGKLPVVVMDHNPANIEQYGNEVDLILSGHTHQGQIFPANLVTRSIFVVDYGHYQKDADSPHVIVTSGAGTWGMPMRIGTRNEIVSITLQ